MSWTVLSIVAASLLTLPQAGAQGGAKTADDTASTLEKELSNRRAEWMKAYSANPKSKKLGAYPSINDMLDRAWKLIEPDPTTDAAGAVLCWIVRERAKPDAMQRALALIQKHHLMRSDLARVCSALQYQITPGVESFLRAAREKSQRDDVRSQASYTLAKVLMRRAASADSLASLTQEKRKEREKLYASYYGQDTVAALAKAEPAKLRSEAEEHFAAIVEADSSSSLAKRAKRDLYELRNLQIGMTAPDITGQDVDGVAFSLSDYRGKVVVLDFWGDW